MRVIERNIVSALLISRDKKVLLGQKDPAHGGVYLDCWHIPGGGIEDGETKLAALQREVKEEVGIDISPYKIELLDDTFKGESEKFSKAYNETVLCKMNFNSYRVHIPDQDAQDILISLNDDLVEIVWIDLAKLGDYKVAAPQAALWRQLGII